MSITKIDPDLQAAVDKARTVGWELHTLNSLMQDVLRDVRDLLESVGLPADDVTLDWIPDTNLVKRNYRDAHDRYEHAVQVIVSLVMSGPREQGPPR